jgi:hypothetical protein
MVQAGWDLKERRFFRRVEDFKTFMEMAGDQVSASVYAAGAWMRQAREDAKDAHLRATRPTPPQEGGDVAQSRNELAEKAHPDHTFQILYSRWKAGEISIAEVWRTMKAAYPAWVREYVQAYEMMKGERWLDPETVEERLVARYGREAVRRAEDWLRRQEGRRS